MSFGSPSRLRIMNDQAALRYMLEAGSISRAGLEELTGLSKPATAELLQRLEAAGLVEKAGKRDGGPGPKAQMWSVNADAGFAAAAHVTSDGVEVVVSDLRGRQRGRASNPWAGSPSPAARLPELLRECLDKACDEASVGREQMLHMVVGVPEALDPRTGLLKYTPHVLSGWEGQDMVSVLQQETGVSTQIENDVNLMALSELESGLTGDGRNFVLIWFDEGLGSAVVLERELFRGVSGGAGEIEYMMVPDPAEPKNGAVRTGARLAELLSPSAITDLAAVHHLDFADPADAIRAATEQAAGRSFLSDLAARVACGLTAVVTLLDPELILLGGRFSAAGGRPFAGLVQEKLADFLSTSPAKAVPVIPYPVSGGAVIAGALQQALARARFKAFETGSLTAR